MNSISAIAHNDQICKDIEKRLNELIRIINKNDGMIWLQTKSNKDHTYMLTEEVTIGFLMNMTEKKDEEETKNA